MEFGGAGAGVHWETHVHSFVCEKFFKGDKKAVGVSTVRRMGMAPNRNNNAARFYRGEIKAR